MTRAERRKRLAEAYRCIAAELDHHVANGSEWLHLEPDGTDSPADVVELRFAILKREIRRARLHAQDLEACPKTQRRPHR